LPWTTLQNVCEVGRVDPAAATFSYAGVNHLGWFSTIRSGTRDIVREYVSSRDCADEFPSRALIEFCGGIPLKYLRLHYEREDVLDEQRARVSTRADELKIIQRNALSSFSSGNRASIGAALRARPTPWYDQAVAPLIAGLVGVPTRIPLFLSRPIEDCIEGFERDDILEVPYRIEARTLRRMTECVAIPSAARPLLESLVRFERAAAQAVLLRSPAAVTEALRIHPWVADAETAYSLSQELVSAVAS